jgi:pyruvoyl-dependent arginine decarboxylase (PvlArgDC)
VSGTVVATFSIAVSTSSAVATVSTVDGADEIAEGDLLFLVIAQVGSSVAGANLTALVELDGSADQDGVDVHSVSVLRGNHPGSVVA